MILAKPSVPLSPNVTDAQTKLTLNIPQLTLGDWAQMDRYGDENVGVEGSNPTEGKQFC